MPDKLPPKACIRKVALPVVEIEQINVCLGNLQVWRGITSEGGISGGMEPGHAGMRPAAVLASSHPLLWPPTA